MEQDELPILEVLRHRFALAVHDFRGILVLSIVFANFVITRCHLKIDTFTKHSV